MLIRLVWERGRESELVQHLRLAGGRSHPARRRRGSPCPAAAASRAAPSRPWRLLARRSARAAAGHRQRAPRKLTPTNRKSGGNFSRQRNSSFGKIGALSGIRRCARTRVFRGSREREGVKCASRRL